MRKFYVTFYNDEYDIENTTIVLELGEKSNDQTFQAKINEKYLNNRYSSYCFEVLSWSLIEE